MLPHNLLLIDLLKYLLSVVLNQIPQYHHWINHHIKSNHQLNLFEVNR